MNDSVIRVTHQTLDVLEVLVRANGEELTGWQIAKKSKVHVSTVYHMLERLADGGMAVYRPDGNRRLHQLTTEGVREAKVLLHQHRPLRW